MTAFLGVAAAAVLVTMMMAIARAALGPTLHDRILSVNTFGTATVLLIALLGYLTGRTEFLDLAMLYALLNFIGTIAFLKFFKYGNLAEGGD